MLRFNKNTVRGDYVHINFNTSYVKVQQRNEGGIIMNDFNFNTSYVKVQPNYNHMEQTVDGNFNTSYVKVQQKS